MPCAVLCYAQELEALRAEGKIRAYGLATWESFRTPPDALQVCVCVCARAGLFACVRMRAGSRRGCRRRCVGAAANGGFLLGFRGTV